MSRGARPLALESPPDGDEPIDDPLKQPSPSADVSEASEASGAAEKLFGEALKVETFRAKVQAISAAEPVIKQPMPHKVVTFGAMALLLFFGLSGMPPSSPLVTPKKLDAKTAGQAVPDEAWLDPSVDWFHPVKTDELRLKFSDDNRILQATAQGRESGRQGKELALFEGRDNLTLRVFSEDDYQNSSRGRTMTFRSLEDGCISQRSFFDEGIELDFQVSVAKDEAKQQRRCLDLILTFRNVSLDKQSFGYELTPVSNLSVAKPMDLRFLNCVAMSTVKGKLKTHRLSLQNLRNMNLETGWEDPKAIGVLNRYAVVAMVGVGGFGKDVLSHAKLLVNDEYRETIVDGEVKGWNGFTFGFQWKNERIRLEPKKEITHHFRVFLGPKSTWTLSGSDEVNLTPLSSDSWAINRFFREIELNFIRGFLAYLTIPGLAILAVGLLTALMLRPMNMSSTWSYARMAALQPIFDWIDAQSRELALELNEAESRRQVREIVNSNRTELTQKHGIRSTFGCLAWILMWPVFLGFYDAIETSYALRAADFLWIKDLAQPDRLIIFAEPLLEIDFYKLIFPEPPAGQAAIDLTYRIKSLNLLAILLYSMTWIEWIWLRVLGIRQSLSVFWTLIGFVFFMLILYNMPAGVHLGFLLVYTVRMVDRVTIYKTIVQETTAARAAMQQAAAPTEA